MRGEDGPLLADDILWFSVLVAHGIPNLSSTRQTSASQAPPAYRPASSALTCMFTRMPSPLFPDTIAVTTTSVSLPTKFRTHRSFLWSWECEVAWRSNLSARAQARKSARLQMYCRSDRGVAIFAGSGVSVAGGRWQVDWVSRLSKKQ